MMQQLKVVPQRFSSRSRFTSIRTHSSLTRPFRMDNIDLGRLQSRNVQVYRFWHSAKAPWEMEMTPWEAETTPWAIFRYDPEHQQHGEHCPPGADIVPPGSYTLLSTGGEYLQVFLQADDSPQEAHYQLRSYARDQRCLITGLQADTYSRLKVAHIFPQGHDAEWAHKGYPSRITDTADEAVMGPMKINSIQNLITLRGDLYDAWENYEYGVDPNNNYQITAFTNGNEDINGCFLQLEHIKDSTLRPLDELFTDHFIQGLNKHMKGTGHEDEDEDDEDEDDDDDDSL
ncbi:hypothetical protein BGW80DRAFT_1278393 [Lactifluus volemus]|nr:hypothetical protein BGW80DRAFT_1278393 [Lactifluus volemus]